MLWLLRIGWWDFDNSDRALHPHNRALDPHLHPHTFLFVLPVMIENCLTHASSPRSPARDTLSPSSSSNSSLSLSSSPSAPSVPPPTRSARPPVPTSCRWKSTMTRTGRGGATMELASEWWESCARKRKQRRKRKTRRTRRWLRKQENVRCYQSQSHA